MAPGRRRVAYAALGSFFTVLGLILLVRTVWLVASPALEAAPSPTPTPVAPPSPFEPGVATTAPPSPTAVPLAPAAVPTTSTAPQPVGPVLAGQTVVLDPGHNGRNAAHLAEISRQVDAGGFTKDCNTVGSATDRGERESAINWSLTQAVQTRLAALGARVVLTRPDDEGWGPCINDRAGVAQRERADLLLSIHADGAPATGHGFHIISPGPLPGYTDRTAAPSAALARHLRDALVSTAGLTPATYLGDRGLVVRTDLGTLNLAGVPAVIVECGNLRNPDDAGLLTSGPGQQRIADGLVAGVTGFLTSAR